MICTAPRTCSVDGSVDIETIQLCRTLVKWQSRVHLPTNICTYKKDGVTISTEKKSYMYLQTTNRWVNFILFFMSQAWNLSAVIIESQPTLFSTYSAVRDMCYWAQ